jgi:hypothetical protein
VVRRQWHLDDEAIWNVRRDDDELGGGGIEGQAERSGHLQSRWLLALAHGYRHDNTGLQIIDAVEYL